MSGRSAVRALAKSLQNSANLSDVGDANEALENLGLDNVDNTSDASKAASGPIADALGEKLDTSGAVNAVLDQTPTDLARPLIDAVFDIINPADLGAETAVDPVEIIIPAGQSRLINNAMGYTISVGLEAGAEAWLLDQGGMSYITPGNVPIADGSSAFVPVSRSLNMFSNGDALATLGQSIDDFTLPFGTHRIESGTLGTFPNATDKAGYLLRMGKPTDIKDLLYTDTFGIFMRRAVLSGGVMAWGAWVACAPTPTTAGAFYVRIGSKYQFASIADDGVGVIDMGATSTANIVRVVDNQGNGGTFAVRAAASPLIRAMGVTTGGTTVSSVNTALTGTTGTDGNITIGCDAAGKIYIENRSGAGRSFLAWVEKY